MQSEIHFIFDIGTAYRGKIFNQTFFESLTVKHSRERIIHSTFQMSFKAGV
jgi:hypothetical protein